MVSIPCNCSPSPRPPLPTRPKPKPRPHLPTLFPPMLRRSPHPLNAAVQTNLSAGPEPADPRRQQQQIRTLFPGGFKRPEIKVPTLALTVSSEEVLGREDSASAIGAAVSKGVGMVVLDSKGDDTAGGRLYEAACVVKEVVGDRTYFLISERVDVASAVGASGVVLSDQGIPAIVARNMMMKSKSDAVYLPLVARKVLTAESAVNASSSEGADFLIISNMRENYSGLLGNFATKHVKVPIFFTITDSIGDDFPETLAQKLLQSGISGIVMSLDDLKLFGDDALNKTFSAAYVANRKLKDGYPNSNRLAVKDARNVLNEDKGIAGFTKLNVKEIRLIEDERLLLTEAVTVIRRAVPTMKEVALLVDAASRLTQPFMIVIVGEFNSGKSTVINALLGKGYLSEGVVPTTNEITLLSYSETDFDGQERCERHPDGQFICYLSAPILKDMNLVDTPGTNVILQRQQRLTEEFVPRADLILFVLSSDRPLTESEVAFLLYVQQWKKKVVFVLNKVDLYRDTSELEEATTFIKENTRKLLNAEDIRLYPVSARFALEAKLSASNYNIGNYQEILFNDPRWITSKFHELENFLFSFLDGSTVTGMERMRLKLETPISIADRLLTSSVILVKEECENASQDLMSIGELVSSVKVYAMKMESESISWRKRTASTIETAKARTIELVESTLQLSNIDLISTYALKGEKSGSTPAISSVQNEIISPTLTYTQKLLEEYSMWLQSSNTREGKHYLERFYEQWHAFVDNKDGMQLETYELLTKGDEFSIKVINNFSASAAARLFEKEIREIVLGTFGGLGAAGLSASLLTSVLPTTLEDLLALAFCSAGGFLAISNFPARRREAIEKVRKVADGLAREIDEAMQKELMQAMENLSGFVEVISKPYRDAAQCRIDRLIEIQDDLAKVEGKLQNLKVEIHNLHVS